MRFRARRNGSRRRRKQPTRKIQLRSRTAGNLSVSLYSALSLRRRWHAFLRGSDAAPRTQSSAVRNSNLKIQRHTTYKKFTCCKYKYQTGKTAFNTFSSGGKSRAVTSSNGTSGRRAETSATMTSVMFETERFIAEIQKRPAIYDVNCEQYLDKSAKVDAWEQVCEIMVPKWRSLSDELKNAEEKILRGKWRNIRDYFMKELKAQKLQRNRIGGKKRKKYMYFEQLQFLLSNAEQAANKKLDERSDAPPQHKQEEINIEEDPLQPPSLMEEDYGMPLTHDSLTEDYPNEVINDPGVVTPNDPMYSQFPKSICETSMASTAEDYPDPISNSFAGNQTVVDEDDYDKMFLLSMLPIMRKLSEEKKLDVRIQMQQIIAQALRESK